MRNILNLADSRWCCLERKDLFLLKDPANLNIQAVNEKRFSGEIRFTWIKSAVDMTGWQYADAVWIGDVKEKYRNKYITCCSETQVVQEFSDFEISFENELDCPDNPV